MTDKEHEELLTVLLKHQGKVLLSGYDNELYNTMLSGWKKESIMTRAEGGAQREETLWMNYSADGQMSIFDLGEKI